MPSATCSKGTAVIYWSAQSSFCEVVSENPLQLPQPGGRAAVVGSGRVWRLHRVRDDVRQLPADHRPALHVQLELHRLPGKSPCLNGIGRPQTWYQKWLLATPSTSELRVSNLPPCREWCHYAELACPFFNRFDDEAYAGLPAFRCEGACGASSTEHCMQTRTSRRRRTSASACTRATWTPSRPRRVGR